MGLATRPEDFPESLEDWTEAGNYATRLIQWITTMSKCFVDVPIVLGIAC